MHIYAPAHFELCDFTNIITQYLPMNCISNTYIKSDVKCWNTLRCLDQYSAPNSKYAGPQSHPNPNPKGLLPVAQPKWSHHETVMLWNRLWLETVPMAVPLIGSLPPQAFKSPHIVGVTWKPDGVTKEIQWWVPLNVHKKLSLGLGFEIKNWIDD